MRAGRHTLFAIVAKQSGRMVALRDAYITGTGVFLPGAPVGNDRMEDLFMFDASTMGIVQPSASNV